MIALIPARSGSKRIPGKNVKLLGGVPLMCWTINCARKSGVFSMVVVSTDSIDYAKLATARDADVVMRPKEYATDTSPDYDWVKHAMDTVMPPSDSFAILRPTSPFRSVGTIRRAHEWFVASGADSIRAVELVKQHPAKMWVVRGSRMLPLLPLNPEGQPWHSQQRAALPDVYAQNASLEMAWAKTLTDTHTISGNTVAPFFTNWLEGFDINSPSDWTLAEQIVQTGRVEVPK